MLLINKPYITEADGKSRLVAEIVIDNKEKKQIYFEVDNEYAKYLCYERSDAFLIGLLNWAMRHNHNIKCITPVTEELLFNINEYLIPSLTKNDKLLSKISIDAPVENEPVANAGGVGTGMSCGVDSFHCIHNLYNSKYKGMQLTHLCINSVGSFHNGYKRYGVEKARNEVRQRAISVAKELNLPLIISASNIKEEFEIYFEHGHTYYSMFAVYCMQKLWKVYYYASTYTFAYFSLRNNSKKDTAYYELLSLQCFSTHNLRIYSEGATEDRLEKTKTIVDDKLPQKYLHVCCTKGINCGKCLKCRRTMLTLDILGKLDDYKEVFDIDYYKTHRDEYLRWLYESCQTRNIMLKPIYNALKHEFNFKFKLRYKLLKLKYKLSIWGNRFHNIISRICNKKTSKKNVIYKILFIKISFKKKN